MNNQLCSIVASLLCAINQSGASFTEGAVKAAMRETFSHSGDVWVFMESEISKKEEEEKDKEIEDGTQTALTRAGLNKLLAASHPAIWE